MQPDDPTSDSQTLSEAVESMARAGEGHRVSVRDLLQTLESRSAAPALLLPGVVLVSPLSGVPLVPSFCGLLIVTIALQLLVHRRCIRLPAVIERVSIRRGRAYKAFRRVAVPARRLDGLVKTRLRPMFRAPVYEAAIVLCLALGLCTPLTEVVPFSSTLVGTAVCLLALGLMAGDGVVLLVGVSVVAVFTIVALPTLAALVLMLAT